MNTVLNTRPVGLALWSNTLVSLGLLGASALVAHATDNRAPEVPYAITVEKGNVVHFHGFGIGVQIYTWNGADWGKAVPEATLFDDEGNVVALHFAGPTWQSNSGSTVRGALAVPPLVVDTNSIPWLLLAAVNPQGPGIFAETTFIQRVNTIGGHAPLVNGTFVGQIARVPYSADYFFFRASNK